MSTVGLAAALATCGLADVSFGVDALRTAPIIRLGQTRALIKE